MKKTLPFYIALFAVLFAQNQGLAQSTSTSPANSQALKTGVWKASTFSSAAAAGFAEPTINGTLDQLTDIKKDEEKVFNVFIKAGDRAGEKANFRMKLDDPALRDSLSIQYTVDPDFSNPDAAVFTALEFDENGIAMIGPEGGEPLKDSEIVFKIVFKADGVYSYQLQIFRDDLNVIAMQNESVTVGEKTTTGIDDMIGDKRVVVYPTVSEGLVRVDLGNIRNASVAVLDVLGRKVLELSKVNGKAEINTQKFAKGTYYVKVYAGKDVATSRLVVK